MTAERPFPWLLVVVDGPSEARDTGGGAIRKIIREVFGAEAAENLDVVHWGAFNRRHLADTFERSRSYAQRAVRAARFGTATTAYGTILLLDNDHRDQDHLAEIRAALVTDEELPARSAVGVAREMLEAWLLADPALCSPAHLPKRPPDALWGAKHDPASNHPKRVLERIVLKPRGWRHSDATDAWEPARARPHSPSLDAFMLEVEALARRQGVA
jgi:hypothetical protein